MKKFIENEITVFRIQEIKGEDGEVPGDFDNEIHKWALECWYNNF